MQSSVFRWLLNNLTASSHLENSMIFCQNTASYVPISMASGRVSKESLLSRSVKEWSRLFNGGTNIFWVPDSIWYRLLIKKVCKRNCELKWFITHVSQRRYMCIIATVLSDFGNVKQGCPSTFHSWTTPFHIFIKLKWPAELIGKSQAKCYVNDTTIVCFSNKPNEIIANLHWTPTT